MSALTTKHSAGCDRTICSTGWPCARLEAKSARLLGVLVAARREARSLVARLETMEMEQMKKEVSS